mgnify:CR=1 FL=1
MAKRLVCWLGMTDIKCSTGEYKGLGPIGKALSSGAYEHAHILADYPKEAVASYRAWADGLSDTKLHIHTAKLDSPMEFNDVYQAAVKVVRTVKHTDPSVELTYHVSPGTSVMAAVWIILAGSTHPATLINSSIEKGIEELKVPLYIASDYVPELLAKANAADQGITELAGAKPMVGAAFEQILHQSPEMKRLVRQSAQVAPRSLPVLLQGESGTGKELAAQTIHELSPRSSFPFVAIAAAIVLLLGLLTPGAAESSDRLIREPLAQQPTFVDQDARRRTAPRHQEVRHRARIILMPVSRWDISFHIHSHGRPSCTC